MKVVCESAPHFLSPLPTRSVPRCIGLHTKILARTVDVIGMHITHMIMPNAFASALARSRFNALRANVGSHQLVRYGADYRQAEPRVRNADNDYQRNKSYCDGN